MNTHISLQKSKLDVLHDFFNFGISNISNDDYKPLGLALIEFGETGCITIQSKMNVTVSGFHKKVRCKRTGEIYQSIKDVCKMLKISPTTFRSRMQMGSFNYEIIK